MHTIQPAELASDRPYGEWSCRGRDIWDAFCAADKGDAGALRDVLARDPNLHRAEYWYTPAIHFADRDSTDPGCPGTTVSPNDSRGRSTTTGLSTGYRSWPTPSRTPGARTGNCSNTAAAPAHTSAVAGWWT